MTGRIRQILRGGAVLAAMGAAALPAFGAKATLVADAHVNAALPGANSGSISNLNVGGGYTALVQFDLSMLPAGTTAAQVSRAVLRIYCNRVDVAGVVSVRAATGDWGEYSVTYATLPSLAGGAQTVQVTQAGTFVAVDVTTLVQGWVAAPATNHGVALTAALAAVQFDSKENDLTGHAAELELEMVSSSSSSGAGAQGPAGPAGPVGPQGPAGPVGPQGAVGPIGPQGVPGLNYRGGFSAAVAYGVGDAVGYGGSSYVSLVAGNVGNVPGASPSAWGLLAAAGTVGATGSAGAVGPMGPMGPAGPVGAAGPAGPAGAPGSPGLAYRGGYVSNESYGLGDVVFWEGSSYVSLVAGNRGNIPDGSPSLWGTLASQGEVGLVGLPGVAGPTGPSGAAATVAVGTVTTGAPGSAVSVTNSGTANAAVLNFTIPQAGTGGGSTAPGGAGGFPSMYHGVSYTATYYSIANTNADAGETAAVMTWVPAGCTVSQLSVFSQQTNTIQVMLRQGTPGSMADAGLSCSVGPGEACVATGSVAVAAGNFLDLSITGAGGAPAGVWTAVRCE